MNLRGEVASDESEVPAGLYVIAPFGGIGGWGNTSWGSGYDQWSDEQSPYLGETVSGNGTWDVYLSELSRDDYVSSCSHYGAVEVKVTNLDTSGGPPPPPTVDPASEAEDAMWCAPSSTGVTTFQLVDLPTWRHAVPLAVAGDQQYGGSELTQVTVTNWKNADKLVLRRGTNVVTLTPTNATATLTAGTWPLGATSWYASRSTAGTWQNPEVQLSHSCASSQPTAVSVAQGYALSLSQLDSAISSATGGVGLSDIVTSGSAGSWPVYTVRVVPMLAMPGTGVTHALRLEMPGIRASAALPLVQTGTDAWDLDVARGDYELHGTVTRTSSNLTLALSSGSVATTTGSLTLQSTSVTLSHVPTDTQQGGQ